jgi:transposase
MADRTTYVGLDVHKEGIVVAVAAGGLRGEVREYGRIANTPTALDRLLRKLGGDGVRLRFCYEAGPCGYGIQRQVSATGHECVVVAPSLIPRRAGDRIKTDRRDAASLARLHRAGELTAVWVPDEPHSQRATVASQTPMGSLGAPKGDREVRCVSEAPARAWMISSETDPQAAPG